MMAGSRIRSRLFTALVVVGLAIVASHGPVCGGQRQVVPFAIAVPTAAPSSAPAGQHPRSLRIPVRSPGRSFHQVAAALAQAARTGFAAGRLFEFDAGLGDYAGNADAQRELRSYEANARFLLPNNDLKYVDVEWLLPHPEFPDLSALGAWVREDEFVCINAECESEVNRPEPAGLHPALREWRIDRGQIARAVAAHPDLFREGLMSVTVTTTIRVRTPGKVFGTTGADKSAALRKLAADQAVVAVVEAPHPCDIVQPGEYWTGYLCGHYLIIDGADGSDLVAGPYHEFHQED
jgi:hypothetical protein